MHLLLSLMLLPPVTPAPADLLREWDARRAAAYEQTDPAALRGLYADRSPAGRHDVAVLDAYRARGLVVWMRAQVFAVQTEQRSPTRLRLRVTDRTLTVVGDGLRCRPLPTSQPMTREVTMVRAEDRWLVTSVRPVPRAARR